MEQAQNKTQVATVERGGAVQHNPSLYEMLGALVRDPTIDPARIVVFLDIKEREEKRQAEKEFTAAMNRLQQKLPRISKRGRIEFTAKSTGVPTSTPFAKYEDVWTVVGPLLLEEGFTVSFGTKALADKGVGILIEATLHHIAGHSQTEVMPLPFDTSGSKNSIQAVGSTLSYGKRYLLFAMLNLVTEGEDNDGSSISAITDDQQMNIETLMHECRLTEEGKSKYLEFIGVKALKDLQQGGYKAAINFLVAKRKAMEEKGK
jgi:hypothetical protein